MSGAFDPAAFDPAAFWVEVVTPTADNDGGHWHYLLEQKKKRARKRLLAKPKVWEAKSLASDAIGLASLTVLPTEARTAASSVADAVGSAIFSIAAFSLAGTSQVQSSTATASFRIVNVLDELRDLEDMVDLYALLVDA